MARCTPSATRTPPSPAPCVVDTPDIGVGTFRDVAGIIDAGGPPDRERVAATMKRYGLAPVAA